jgi:hypothetical protein
MTLFQMAQHSVTCYKVIKHEYFGVGIIHTDTFGEKNKSIKRFVTLKIYQFWLLLEHSCFYLKSKLEFKIHA